MLGPVGIGYYVEGKHSSGQNELKLGEVVAMPVHVAHSDRPTEAIAASIDKESQPSSVTLARLAPHQMP